ncbi:hypothetical protein N9003_01705, partial [bacterium]|nr:hypothetical protein [bacterium]
MNISSFVSLSFRPALCGIFALVAGSVAQAQVIDWNNTSGTGAWYETNGNWVGGAAPTATETARFNQAATYDVWWDNLTSTTTPEVGFLQVVQGDVTFDNRDTAAGTQYLYTINGSGGAIDFSDFSISGSGTSFTNRGLHLQSLGGGQILGGATLTLDGSDPNGAKLTVGDAIGFDVSGNLNIQSGATFENTYGYIGRKSGSTGVATVTGSGSQWNNSGRLYLGYDGNGTLNVEAGGVVNSDRGYISYFPGSTGVATVTGSGSQWNNSTFLSVGDFVNGTLNVEAGGLVSNTDGYIGRNSGSTGVATVTGSGSQWNNSGSLDVGKDGNGTLNVEAGGVVSNTDGWIGDSSDSTGTATVTGGGSQWNNL